MNIDVAYGRDLDDDLLNQLMYMEADAYAYYDNLNSSDNEIVIAAIPTTTVKQFKRKHKNTLFLMKTMKERSKVKLVGMACLSKQRNDLCFHTVYVKPLHRKQGIGSALVKKAISIAKKNGSNVFLHANPLNIVAINLYSSYGFKISKNQTIQMDFEAKKKNGTE